MIRRDPRSYGFALDVFRSLHGLPPAVSGISQSEAAEHLESLQPAARRLRELYRQSRPEIAYSGDLCDAYLFVYSVPYSRVLSEVIEVSGVSLSTSEQVLRCCILGGGPTPELISLHWLASKAPERNPLSRIQRLDALVIDHHAAEWNRIVHTVASELSRLNDGPVVTTRCIGSSLTDPEWIEKNGSFLAESNLLVLQNVLNEISQDEWPTFVEVLGKAFDRLPDRAQVIIVDLRQHSTSSDRLLSLAEMFRKSTVERRRSSAKISKARTDAFVSTHLLTGVDGLKSRTNVEVDYLILERRRSPDRAS